MVFWGSIATLLLSFAAFIATKQLLHQSRVDGIDRRPIVSIMNAGGIVGLVVGGVGWTVSHLFPDKRKTRWRLPTRPAR
jgi:hypothetical protein